MSGTACDPKVYEDQYGLYYSSTFPGLSFEDFDRKGNISPWRIAKIFDFGTTYVNADLKLYNHDETRTLYVLGGSYTFYKDIYKIKLPHALNDPICLETRIVQLGNTSFTEEALLRDVGSNQILSKASYKLVHINTNTARPMAVTDTIRQEIHKFLPKTEQQSSVKIMEAFHSVPSNIQVFRYDVMTAFSDMDDNWHVNQISYMRFCIDGAMCASVKDFFKCFKSDLSNYKVKETQCLYSGECKANEQLAVYLWEDETVDYQICFIIKKGEDIKCHFKILFYQ